jgi:hypothetical protein
MLADFEEGLLHYTLKELRGAYLFVLIRESSMPP